MAKLKRKPKPKPKPTKYDYFFDSTNKCWCFASNVSRCTVAAALLAGAASDFHDADLQDATLQINKILDRVGRENEDRSRHLSFIEVDGRLMLVWTHHGGATSGLDDARDIAKAFKIKKL
jgi:hypothetical protein